MPRKIHTTVPFYVMGMAAILVSMAVLTWQRFGPTILINETPSEPVGFYRLVAHRPSDFHRGMYVVFPVPETVQALVYGRHWMKDGVPLLKELLGLAGDRVCVLTDRLEVNGRYVGPVFERDREGRALPQIRGCFDVQPDSFFAASDHLDNSFDGRYFGPQPLTQLLGEARPVWTF
jgi:conjugative transfer signal peptidase TraF